ncbi:MAG: formate dehydrogenase accessory sulfurtransferase FdhD [Gemmatimonadota bacterium]
MAPLAPEVEVELRRGDQRVVLWNCTPQHLEDLTVGWLVGEGRIENPERIGTIRVDPDGKTVRIDGEALRSAGRNSEIPTVSLPATSQFVEQFSAPDRLRSLYAEMFARGELREQTGGVHTGALVVGGHVRAVREDVSRHCVVDKLIGACWREGLRPTDCRILLTSRVSGAIAAKVARAGIPVVATMSVPTTLAGSIAARAGVTMIGRGRSSRPHVYRTDV